MIDFIHILSNNVIYFIIILGTNVMFLIKINGNIVNNNIIVYKFIFKIYL